MRAAPRVLVIGDVGGDSTFHVGDEAMLECNLALLRRLLPGVVLSVISLEPEATARRYAVEALPRLGFVNVSADRQIELQRINRWLEQACNSPQTLPPALMAVLDSDLVMISGGGNLSSTWPEHILERLALARFARLRGIPLLVTGQTLGPNLTDGDAELVGELLCEAAWLGLREAHSAALALRLGVPAERIDYQLDDAIGMPGADCVDLWPAEREGASGPRIALTLHPLAEVSSDAPWLDNLASELDCIIEETSARILFIPHAQRAGREQGDQAVGEALVRRLRNPQAMVVLQVRSSAETAWLTRQADVVVSSRYHPLVFASLYGLPCLGLPTDQYTLVKLQGALRHVGAEEHLLALGGDSYAGLADGVIALSQRSRHSAAEREAIRARLEAKSRAREDRLARWLAAPMSPPAGPAVDIELMLALANIVQHSMTYAPAETQLALLELRHWQNTATEALRYANGLSEALTAVELRAEKAEAYALSLEQDRRGAS